MGKALGETIAATMGLAPLTAALADQAPDIQQAAVRGLRAVGDPRAADVLLPLLPKLTWCTCWTDAAYLLGQAGDRRAIRPLVLALVDRRPDVRSAADKALGEIDPNWPGTAAARSTIAELVLALKEGKGERDAAERALARIDSEWPASTQAADAVPALIVALSLAAEQTREAAEHVLQTIDPEWPRTDAARRAIPELVLALAEYGREAHALRALDWIDPNWPATNEARRAIPTLIIAAWRLSDHIDRSRRARAERALARIDPVWARTEPARDAIRELVSGLADPEPERRRAASEILDRIDPGWPRSDVARYAVPELIFSLRHGSGHELATNALNRITGAHLGPNPDEWQRWLDENYARIN